MVDRCLRIKVPSRSKKIGQCVVKQKSSNKHARESRDAPHLVHRVYRAKLFRERKKDRPG
jgi:hypothetical protein